jgi:mannose-1-phosphate guanylyltransferase
VLLATPIVVCNEDQRFLIAQQLQSIGVKKARVLLEPKGRNTAPAIALAALEALRNQSPDALLLVLPADHEIRDVAVFELAVAQAIALAKQGGLVTFGVLPTRPETGYGYIRCGDDSVVLEFVEKPNLDTAQSYLDSGEYLWKSGMFLFKASVYLHELALHRNDIFQAVHKAYQQRKEDVDFVRINSLLFSECPEESIDFAVLEKTTQAKVVPYLGDWSDIGTWGSL